MLDGQRYYGAFPDEKPTLSTLHALLRTLEKLEGEFRRYVEQRWSRLAGQNGGLAKVDSGFDYAANLSLFACVA